MLKSHHYSVVFPTNGVRLEGDFTWQPGCTAVTGDNGKGKTFGVQEVWRYLLFGKKALRGPASHYKTLDAKGEIEIKGKTYVISRTAKAESVTCDGETIAVGADAVNKKMVEILGYGLEVFDVANCAVQKESDKLSKLPAAKRKELIDEVVGLAQNERVEKDCKDKAKQLKMQAEAIIDNLTIPAEPVVPDGYRDSKQIEIELSHARQIEKRRHQLLDITNETLQVPIPPSSPRVNVTELQEHEIKRSAVEAEKKSIREQIALIPVASFTREQVAQAEAAIHYTNEVSRRGPKPEIKRDTAELGYGAWQQIKALKGVDADVACPKCHHIFRTSTAVPPEPPQPEDFFKEQLRRHDAWAKPLKDPGPCELALLNLDTRNKAHTALVRAKDREALETRLMTLPTFDDRSNELANAASINKAWDLFDADYTRFRLRKGKADEAFAELEKLPPQVDIAKLDELFVSSRVHEQRLDDYRNANLHYCEQREKADKLTKEADGFTKGAKALADARKEMKAYLAPSLSRIASSLIEQMTQGRFSAVIVDEDMEITVDGQPITTLSGAQSTAANLALRLALGQVLVSSVLPIFIGDEIDADMAHGNAQATAECLRNLKGHLEQIILITHENLDSMDHCIDLDG